MKPKRHCQSTTFRSTNLHRCARAIVCAALAAPSLFVPVPAVRAHGDAAWIMANPMTRHCCGPQDCHEIPAEHVRMVGETYYVNDPPMAWNSGHTYPSINTNYWACVAPDGRVKCFFAPVMGS